MWAVPVENIQKHSVSSILLLLILLLSACVTSRRLSDEDWDKAARGQLTNHVLRMGNGGTGIPLGERLQKTRELVSFYQKRSFAPAWFSGRSLSDQAEVLLKQIQLAEEQGLDPAAYHLTRLEQLIAAWKANAGKPEMLSGAVDLEVLLSDAFLAYGSDLAYGRVNPRTIDPDWAVERERGFVLHEVLENALSNHSIEKSLAKLAPESDAYTDLKAALADYRKVVAKGGWPVIPSGPAIGKGAQGKRVSILRTRLGLSSGEQFDDSVVQAVRAAQTTFGLPQTGRLDHSTLKALNVPARSRRDQIIVNLERWRWLPRDFGERYVFVNIPSFELKYFKDGKELIRMPVVVGKPDWQTPMLDDEITYLEINPSWNIPRSIATEEILPKLKKDPAYLNKKGLELVENQLGNSTIIDPSTVDWKTMDEEHWHYLIRQPPGPKNALGKIKFAFPNEFAVYLHGTPEKAGFEKRLRSESHGCVRVANPVKLAVALLQDDGRAWSEEDLLKLIQTGEEKVITLKHPVGVHLFYTTAWSDLQHHVHFRQDIYDWDNPISLALRNSETKTPVAE